MSDPERALAEKVQAELKIGELHTTPIKEGWITGFATAIGAFIPVAPFLFTEGLVAIWISFTLAMLSHFSAGLPEVSSLDVVYFVVVLTCLL